MALQIILYFIQACLRMDAFLLVMQQNTFTNTKRKLFKRISIIYSIIYIKLISTE
jgi:hypothetical protein